MTVYKRSSDTGCFGIQSWEVLKLKNKTMSDLPEIHRMVPMVFSPHGSTVKAAYYNPY